MKEIYQRSSSLATYPASKLNVFWHNRHPLGMDRAEIGVLEQPNKVRLSGLLESGDGGALEPEICLEILCYLTDKPLKRELADQELGALLVLSDLSEGDGAGAEAVGLLHSTGCRSGLAGGLGGQLLPRSLAAGGLASGLLGSRH